MNTIEPHKLCIIGHPRGHQQPPSKEGSIILKKPLRISLLHSILNKGEENITREKKQEQQQKEDSSSKQQQLQHRFSKARVLVAEDNSMNQIMIKKVLEKIGFTHITLVENGRKAIEAIQTTPFDLILMEVSIII
jgi:PleD family two-component response regulator